MIINLQGNEQVEDKEGARRIMIQVQRNKLPNPQQDNKDKYTWQILHIFSVLSLLQSMMDGFVSLHFHNSMSALRYLVYSVKLSELQ